MATSKQLLPVYDKPLIFYPLSTLMLASIRDIAVISTPHDLAPLQHLLGDGGQLGLNLTYHEQKQPRGVAEAPIIAEETLEGQPFCLVLGDNVFHGSGLGRALAQPAPSEQATIFAYAVSDPSPYAVVSFDDSGEPASLEEKPEQPKSRWAVPGLYFLPGNAPEVAKELQPSLRAELEITDLMRWYLDRDLLRVRRLPRGSVWLDAGTPDSLLAASHYVHTVAERQGLSVSCPEEIAYRQGWIGAEDVLRQADRFSSVGDA